MEALASVTGIEKLNSKYMKSIKNINKLDEFKNFLFENPKILYYFKYFVYTKCLNAIIVIT
jgi:hypothetical protein